MQLELLILMMQGLDIKDFVGTVLHWSNAIEVLDYEEYVEEYVSK